MLQPGEVEFAAVERVRGGEDGGAQQTQNGIAQSERRPGGDEEIAVVLDMPLGSVKGRLHRARGDLIGLMRNNNYDWDLPG